MRIHFRSLLLAFVACSAAAVASAPGAKALDLDWSGQFRAENHLLHNYSLGGSGNLTTDAARAAAGGYYIPGGGSNEASFQSLFLRLRPRVVVNDNVYLKTELWMGNPTFGIFGDAVPQSLDQRMYYSSQSAGAFVTAQRFWAELQTDVGTVQVGRAPLHWGLGVVWDAGDDVYDRYMSTGDVIRIVSKLGAFTFVPSVVKYSAGNSVGGACTIGAGTTCTVQAGSGNVVDVSVALKYENLDDDLDIGVNFIKRIAGGAPDAVSGYRGITGAASGMNFNTFDLYGRKKFGRFSIAAEVPIASGDIGGIKYNSFAVAGEAQYKIDDSWEVSLRGGRAPGQASGSSATPGTYTAFFFNPGYKPALMLFGMNLAALAGPNTLNNPNLPASALRSPFDNPIANATYGSVTGSFSTDKWRFSTNWAIAQAAETAQAGSAFFFNTQTRSFQPNRNARTQSAFIGWEMDFGIGFQWDESLRFDADFGWMFPGDFWRFSNDPTTPDNAIGSVFGSAIRVGLSF